MKSGKTYHIQGENYLVVVETDKKGQSSIKEIHGGIHYDRNGSLLDRTSPVLPVGVRSDFYYDEISVAEGKITASFCKNDRRATEKTENFDLFYKECFATVSSANPELTFVFPGSLPLMKKPEKNMAPSQETVLSKVSGSLEKLRGIIESANNFKKELDKITQVKNRKNISSSSPEILSQQITNLRQSFTSEIQQLDSFIESVDSKKKKESFVQKRSEMYSECALVLDECNEQLDMIAVQKPVVTEKKAPVVHQVETLPAAPVADSLPTMLQQTDRAVAVTTPEKSELELLRAALLENQEKLEKNEAAVQNEVQKRLQRLEVDASRMKQLTSEARELKSLIDSIKKQIAVLQCPVVVQPEANVESPLNLPGSKESVVSSARFRFPPPRVIAPMSPAEVAKLPLGYQLPHLERMHDQSNLPSERAELAAKIAHIKIGLSNHTLFASPLAEAFLTRRPSSTVVTSSSRWADFSDENILPPASSLRR